MKEAKPNLVHATFGSKREHIYRACIFKESRIDSEESIPPACVVWRASKTNRVVVLACQAWNRFLGFLKRFTNTGSDKFNSLTVLEDGHK